MPVYFENSSARIHARRLGPWRVTDKATGVETVPPQPLRRKLTATRGILRGDLRGYPEMRAACEHVLFGHFAAAALDETSPAREMFDVLRPDDILDLCRKRAIPQGTSYLYSKAAKRPPWAPR